jgi:hypothetical protein
MKLNQLFLLPFLALSLAVGSSAQQPAPTAPSAQTQKFFSELAEIAKAKSYGVSEFEGNKGGNEFDDVSPDGGVLVGFDIWQGSDRVKTGISGLCPIFETATGRVRGKQHGGNKGEKVTIEAKPGYAVAGVEIKAADRVTGVSVYFMKYAPGNPTLSSEGAYNSNFVGEPGKRSKKVFLSQKIVLGIHGASGWNLDRLGLLYVAHK